MRHSLLAVGVVVFVACGSGNLRADDKKSDPKLEQEKAEIEKRNEDLKRLMREADAEFKKALAEHEKQLAELRKEQEKWEEQRRREGWVPGGMLLGLAPVPWLFDEPLPPVLALRRP